MPIVCRTSPELYPNSAAERHPLRSVWVNDAMTAGGELRIDGDVMGAYGVRGNGKPFVQCGNPDAPASEMLSIHMRTPDASHDKTKRAITALALSMWQITY